MIVYKLDPLSDVRWVKFTEKHPKTSVFHTRDWLEALRMTKDRWGATRSLSAYLQYPRLVLF